MNYKVNTLDLKLNTYDDYSESNDHPECPSVVWRHHFPLTESLGFLKSCVSPNPSQKNVQNELGTS